MTENLIIKNFKCFQNADIPLNMLTVMAGANGNGKSTAIQCLLLMRKTIEENFRLQNGYYMSSVDGSINRETDINKGYLLNLGNNSLITNRQLSGQDIFLEVDSGENKFYIQYNVESALSSLSIYADSSSIVSTAKVNEIPILKQQFYYLNAERIGPRISQSIQHYDFPNAGSQGENLAQMIADVNYKMEIDKVRRHPSSASPRLEQQLNAWLDSLMPGVRVYTNPSMETLTAQIRVENQFTKGEPTLATNIGFGISYVLPILATGLIAEKGSYMIVENPEAHLHPSAQSQIGRFLAIIAHSGVHVFVETHSDHVINGIQIAVAKSEIRPDDVTINFFSQKQGQTQPNIESIQINEKGELSLWPRGFFDQTQIDLAELFKLRKS